MMSFSPTFLGAKRRLLSRKIFFRSVFEVFGLHFAHFSPRNEMQMHENVDIEDRSIWEFCRAQWVCLVSPSSVRLVSELFDKFGVHFEAKWKTIASILMKIKVRGLIILDIGDMEIWTLQLAVLRVVALLGWWWPETTTFQRFLTVFEVFRKRMRTILYVFRKNEVSRAPKFWKGTVSKRWAPLRP